MFRSPPRRRKAKDITGDKHIARALHALLQRPGMPVNVITNRAFEASGRCRIGTRKASMALHPRRGHVLQAAGAIKHPQHCALPSPWARVATQTWEELRSSRLNRAGPQAALPGALTKTSEDGRGAVRRLGRAPGRRRTRALPVVRRSRTTPTASRRRRRRRLRPAARAPPELPSDVCRHMARPLRGWAGLASQGTTGRIGRPY